MMTLYCEDVFDMVQDQAVEQVVDTPSVIHLIPLETWGLVLSHASLNDIRSFSLVCKDAASVVSTDYFWRYYIARRFQAERCWINNKNTARVLHAIESGWEPRKGLLRAIKLGASALALKLLEGRDKKSNFYNEAKLCVEYNELPVLRHILCEGYPLRKQKYTHYLPYCPEIALADYLIMALKQTPQNCELVDLLMDMIKEKLQELGSGARQAAIPCAIAVQNIPLVLSLTNPSFILRALPCYYYIYELRVFLTKEQIHELCENFLPYNAHKSEVKYMMDLGEVDIANRFLKHHGWKEGAHAISKTLSTDSFDQLFESWPGEDAIVYSHAAITGNFFLFAYIIKTYFKSNESRLAPEILKSYVKMAVQSISITSLNRAIEEWQRFFSMLLELTSLKLPFVSVVSALEGFPLNVSGATFIFIGVVFETIRQAGFDVSEVGSDGRTPLLKAVPRASASMHHLLGIGADPKATSPTSGDNALHYLCNFGRDPEVFISLFKLFFLKYGLSPKSRNSRQQTAFDLLEKNRILYEDSIHYFFLDIYKQGWTEAFSQSPPYFYTRSLEVFQRYVAEGIALTGKNKRCKNLMEEISVSRFDHPQLLLALEYLQEQGVHFPLRDTQSRFTYYSNRSFNQYYEQLQIKKRKSVIF